MRRPDPAAREVLRAFVASGARARVHTTIRWWTCPFPDVAELLPETGRILDLGCGHGHFATYLALTAPGRTVVGVDVDPDKVAVGSEAVVRSGLGGRVELLHVDDGWRPDAASFDAVVANDVLYLLGRARARSALTAIAAGVRPGGTVVVKEMASTPRWKYRLNLAQEQVATRVLRLTAGNEVDVLGETEIEDPLRDAGLVVTSVRLDRWYLHPHLAVVARRPVDASGRRGDPGRQAR